jgi:hypothetical protein
MKAISATAITGNHTSKIVDMGTVLIWKQSKLNKNPNGREMPEEYKVAKWS